MTTRSTVLFAALGVLASQHLDAGLLDSPPPALLGKASQVTYRLGPVYFQPGLYDTVVVCTNHDATSANVGIELFDEQDEPAGSAVASQVAPETVVTFATSTAPTTGHLIVLVNIPPLEHGKARVVSTTTKLSCAAYHRIHAADGTINEQALALVKRVSNPAQQ